MALTELLEQDKERILQELGRAGTPDRAVPVLEKELDRLLMNYTETCGSAAAAEEAGALLKLLRLSLQFLDCAGEPRVWESVDAKAVTAGAADDAAGKKPGSVSKKTLVLLPAGALCGLIALFLAARDSSGALHLPQGGSITWIFFAVSLAACVLAGIFLRTGKGSTGKKTRMVETTLDVTRLWNRFRAAVIRADQTLREIESEEKSTQNTLPADSAYLTPGSVEFFAGLLEAGKSGDGEYALEKLGDVRYFLHKNGIEAVDRNETNGELFDTLPGEQSGTIRPALTAGGKVLKRGLASGSR